MRHQTPSEVATIEKAVQKLGTVDNARKWFAEDEQWVFCLDLLNMTTLADGEDKCDYAVGLLEDRFEAILACPEAFL